MKITATRAQNGQSGELVFLIVLVVTGLAGLAWLALRMPTPACLFHAATGLPCPTCGGSRAARSLFEGDVPAAFAWNPLLVLGAAGCGVAGVYALGVVCGWIPQLRIGKISRSEATILRVAVVAAVVANWIYLVLRGV